MAAKKTLQQACARAYCSSANLGPGFDSFGLALDAFYDEIIVSRNKKQNGSGSIVISYAGATATAPCPPTSPDANTAGIVARSMLRENDITDDIKIVIRKGVPAGLGLGSSAASAAASAVACSSLFGLKYDTAELVAAAGRGEKASAGVVHYDNVAASVAGGFVIARPCGDSVTVAGFRPASYLRLCVAVPTTIKIPDKKTSVSRGLMPKKIALGDCIQNIANASLLAAALATGDGSMLGRGITSDAIAEPARKRMIPGFDAVREAAIDAGAKEVMISGAGPSVIAIMTGEPAAGTKMRAPTGALQKRVAGAMSAAFDAAGVGCRTIVCRPAGGATVMRAAQKAQR